VLVDGRELTGMGRFSGLGTFTRSLLGALAHIDSVDTRVLTTDRAATPPGVKAIRMWRGFHERRRSVYEHEALISFDVLRCRSDVVYSPVLGGIPFARRPYAQTLHDVIPLVLPDEDLRVQRAWWARWASRYRRADAVVAVSRYTADEGIRVLDLDPRRVHVAHNGVGVEFGPDASDSAADPPYILLVSEYSARKGFADAFTVVGALAEAGYPHVLKIAGRVQYQFEDHLAALVRSAPRPDRIEILGFVDDLPELYRGAAAFVFPSRYEGFGLPVLEAMASRVPVVAYRNSSLPEVVGDAAVLVPDGDLAAMIDGVRSILDDHGRRHDLREAGLERSRRFTWDACAAAYAQVFAALCE
jgi:glycosyltransferase involved in cell wall biosynthesis